MFFTGGQALESSVAGRPGVGLNKRLNPPAQGIHITSCIIRAGPTGCGP